MNCTISRARREQYLTGRKRQIFEVSISEGYNGPASNMCTDWEVWKALRVLQANFNIRQTGHFDDQTIRTMSQRRCGNSDVIKTTLLTSSQTSSQTDSPVEDNAVVTRGAAQQRIARRSNKGRLRSRRSVKLNVDLANPTPGGGGATTGPYDLEPVEYVETNAMERRKRMLEEIRNKLERRQTKRDERPLAKRTSGLKVKRRRIRRKRLSTNMGSEDRNSTGEEGTTEGQQRLNRDENTPVRWRLMAEGMSERVPIIEQKATLHLAFRIWGEVIPLRFIEDDDESDLNGIDILLAFGKGTW